MPLTTKPSKELELENSRVDQPSNQDNQHACYEIIDVYLPQAKSKSNSPRSFKKTHKNSTKSPRKPKSNP